MVKKIVTIVGARPQLVKAAAVSRLLSVEPLYQEILLHTGQHYDENMSKIFFEELELQQPAYNLGIGSGTHGYQTGEMLMAIEKILLQEKPDAILIYGDTNSTLAGALAAAKLHIPCAHVEAGLRSFNRRMPEEINRIVADELADLLFTPTTQAVKNLKNEGISLDRIRQVGDVMFDAALFYGEKAEQHSTIHKDLGLKPKQYVLATVHRQENTDHCQYLMAIIQGLKKVADKYQVVLPLHPRTRKMLINYNLMTDLHPALRIIDPVGFLDMLMLEKYASVIATDSGGVQKEAFFYQVPCITLRTETEWVELIESGWNQLVTPDNAETICKMILSAIENPVKENQPSLYGDGNSARKIIRELGELV